MRIPAFRRSVSDIICSFPPDFRPSSTDGEPRQPTGRLLPSEEFYRRVYHGLAGRCAAGGHYERAK